MPWAPGLVDICGLLDEKTYLKRKLSNIDVSSIVATLIMMAIIMLLGTFMDWITIVFITVPVFATVVLQFGYDPVWFGILFAMNIQIYMLSPSFGPACFDLKSVAPKDVTLQEIFLAVMPFIGLQLVGLAMVIAFLQIALWLPSLGQ